MLFSKNRKEPNIVRRELFTLFFDYFAKFRY
jgi:hypothetical protein